LVILGLKILGLFDLSLKIQGLVSSRISYSRNGRSMIGTSICTQQKRIGQLMFSLSVNLCMCGGAGEKGDFLGLARG
jgi:hypothetical protein